MDPYVVMLSNILFPLLFVLSFSMLIFSVASFFRKRQLKPVSYPMSVVIPACNEEQSIGRCLEAVLASKYPGELEVIVVDDGSTDRTVKIARGFKKVRVLKQKHKGKVEALNFGLKEARHGIVTMLDADTLLEQDSLAEIAKPFADSKIAAVSGVVKVSNPKGLLGMFQSVEYIHSSMLKEGFSRFFSMSFGLYGAFSAYRKSVLEKAGGFQKSTVCEDVDICFQIKRLGYKSLTTSSAVCHTIVPTNLKGFIRQRTRWNRGTLQSIMKHKDLISARQAPLTFIMLINIFWSVYSFLSLPLLFYQFGYWLPYNSATATDTGMYFLRWFSFLGPVYTLYMLPVWNLAPFVIFAVLSGIVTTIVMMLGIRLMKEKIGWRAVLAIFFYFPYTILLNIATMFSVGRFILSGGKGTFIK